MSIHGQGNRRVKARVAKYDNRREKFLLISLLLSGGALFAAATLGKLLLMSP